MSDIIVHSICLVILGIIIFGFILYGLLILPQIITLSLVVYVAYMVRAKIKKKEDACKEDHFE